MRLGTRARYAVTAIVDLASTCGGAPVTLADIAARQAISLSYLEQLFARLRRCGLVRSVRGPGGGYLLARPAEETSIAEIIAAVDEPIHSSGCGGADAPAGCRGGEGRCLTHDLWDGLDRRIRRYLHTVTVADVCCRRLPPDEAAAHEVARDAIAAAPPDGAPQRIAAE